MKGPNSSSTRIKLFEHRWLEVFTVISVGWFCAVWSILLPAIAYFAWGSASFVAALGLIAAGWIFWSLFEYFAHSKLFHFEPRSASMKQFMFLLHGNHHVQPTDKLRNLMPPIVSVPVGALVWGALYLALGSAGTWVFIGFMGGYVIYDLTHYACHNWAMRGPISKRIKHHHMRHHFKSDHGNYSITVPLLDRLFGTYVASSANAKAVDDAHEEVLHPAE